MVPLSVAHQKLARGMKVRHTRYELKAVLNRPYIYKQTYLLWSNLHIWGLNSVLNVFLFDITQLAWVVRNKNVNKILCNLSVSLQTFLKGSGTSFCRHPDHSCVWLLSAREPAYFWIRLNYGWRLCVYPIGSLYSSPHEQWGNLNMNCMLIILHVVLFNPRVTNKVGEISGPWNVW